MAMLESGGVILPELSNLYEIKVHRQRLTTTNFFIPSCCQPKRQKCFSTHAVFIEKHKTFYLLLPYNEFYGSATQKRGLDGQIIPPGFFILIINSDFLLNTIDSLLKRNIEVTFPFPPHCKLQTSIIIIIVT